MSIFPISCPLYELFKKFGEQLQIEAFLATEMPLNKLSKNSDSEADRVISRRAKNFSNR